MASKFGTVRNKDKLKEDSDDEYVVEIENPLHHVLGDEELVDRSLLLVGIDSRSRDDDRTTTTTSSPPTTTTATRGGDILLVCDDTTSDCGFDACKEYGYMYEYTDEDEDEDEEEEEEEEEIYYIATGTHNSHSKTSLVSLFSQSCMTEKKSNNNSSISNREYNGADDIVYHIYILGKKYHPTLDYATRRDDESSLFWFTYRCHFPEIAPYGITSDAGWGCMLRSAQMLLGQALRIHYCDRSWKPPKSLMRRRSDPFVQDIMTWFADVPSNRGCWYSLHNMVAAGIAKYQTLPGEWFGPGTSCHILRDLCDMHQKRIQRNKNNKQDKNNGEWEQIGKDDDSNNNFGTKKDSENIYIKGETMMRVYVAQEGSVYRNNVEELMTKDSSVVQEAKQKINKSAKKSSPQKRQQSKTKKIFQPFLHPLCDYNEEGDKTPSMEWDTGLLLLIPLRLGLNSFNMKSYDLTFSHMFSLRQSVGCLGGSPRHALWFYGANSDGTKLYGLDPHTVQNAPQQRNRNDNQLVAVAEKTQHQQNGYNQILYTDKYLRSVNCKNSTTVDLKKIDPSLALGFYCRDRADFDDLWNSLKDVKEAGKKLNLPELFCVTDAAPDYSTDVSSAMVEMMSNGDINMDQDCRDDEASDEDDYIML